MYWKGRKILIASVFGFDCIAILISIMGIVNPSVVSNYIQSPIVYMRVILVLISAIILKLLLAGLLKVFIRCWFILALYYSCLVSIGVSLLMVLASIFNHPFYGFIMIILMVLIIYLAYGNCLLDSIAIRKQEREKNRMVDELE